MMIILLEKDLARAMEKKGFEVFQAEGVQKGIESVKRKNQALLLLI